MIPIENGGGNQFARDGGDSQVVSYSGGESFLSPTPQLTTQSVSIDTDAHGEFFGLPFTAEVDTTNNSDSPTPLVGPDSPFSIFADLVQGALGGGGAAREPQAPTLIPVSSGGGGIGAGALLLVLALIGGAVWWFFVRKKKGASNAD